jgi:hypothetical protein
MPMRGGIPNYRPMRSGAAKASGAVKKAVAKKKSGRMPPRRG